MENQNNNPLHKRQYKDKHLTLQFIVKQVENGTGLSISELKKEHSEERLFAIALKQITTTIKALWTALTIPIEAGCRYKRTLDNEVNLAQSVDEVICPITKYLENQISTNPKEFERLLKSNDNQLNFFE